MKRNPTGRRINRPVESSYESSRSRYVRAFAAARAMRFWRPRMVGKVFSTAAFAAALTVGSSAAQAQFPASFELSTLDGTNGFVINGINRDDLSGESVSSAGDVNGDGFDDVIIGAKTSHVSSPGESYVVFGNGTGFASSVDLVALDGTNGFVVNGTDESDFNGHSVSGAGDFNGDGIDDFIIGAALADPNGNSASGESYVVFGSNSGFSSSFNLSTLDGTNGFVLNGIDAGDGSGSLVSGAGDVNGDGLADIIIGAYGADPNGNRLAGESYVVFGSNGGFSPSLNLSTLDGTNGFVLNGIDADDRSGFTASDAGDVNGDGFDDVIIGANRAGPNGNLSGESYVVFGQGGGFQPSINLNTLDGTNGFTLRGSEGDQSGYSVSGAGDINGDGFDDLIIGANRADANGIVLAGESYVVFGKSGALSAIFDLSTLDGNNGFLLNGIDWNDYSGRSVSGAGDINGDGFDDLIIGAMRADPNGEFQAGESYVVYGTDSGFSASLDLSTLDGTNGFVLNGIDRYDYSGSAVSGAGDVNGDGIDDLIIAAYRADVLRDQAGESYIVFGRRAVPEPASAALLGAGLLGWFSRRRRR